MKIELHEIPARDVVEGYTDSAENGVTGYNGRLNISPAFQREFIYIGRKRDILKKNLQSCSALEILRFQI